MPLTFNGQLNNSRITPCFVGGCQCVHAFKVIAQTRESEAQSIITEHPHEVGEGGCIRISWYAEVVSICKGPLDVPCLHLWGSARDGEGQSDTHFLDTYHPSLVSLHSGGN